MTRTQSVTVPNTNNPINAVGTTGTGVFTVWGNVASLSSKSTVLNPYAIENSTSATDDIAYVFDVPKGYNWLDTYVAVLAAAGSTAALNITTALKGVFFGKFPTHQPGEKNNATPRFNSISGWDAALAEAGPLNAGIWLPLDNPVSGTTEFTFPSGSPPSPLLRQDVKEATATYPNLGGLTDTTTSAIRCHQVTARTSVYLAGASRVMFLPTQAAALSAGTGLLLGRFVV